MGSSVCPPGCFESKSDENAETGERRKPGPLTEILPRRRPGEGTTATTRLHPVILAVSDSDGLAANANQHEEASSEYVTAQDHLGGGGSISKTHDHKDRGVFYTVLEKLGLISPKKCPFKHTSTAEDAEVYSSTSIDTSSSPASEAKPPSFPDERPTPRNNPAASPSVDTLNNPHLRGGSTAREKVKTQIRVGSRNVRSKDGSGSGSEEEKEEGGGLMNFGAMQSGQKSNSSDETSQQPGQVDAEQVGSKTPDESSVENSGSSSAAEKSAPKLQRSDLSLPASGKNALVAPPTLKVHQYESPVGGKAQHQQQRQRKSDLSDDFATVQHRDMLLGEANDFPIGANLSSGPIPRKGDNSPAGPLTYQEYYFNPSSRQHIANSAPLSAKTRGTFVEKRKNPGNGQSLMVDQGPNYGKIEAADLAQRARHTRQNDFQTNEIIIPTPNGETSITIRQRVTVGSEPPSKRPLLNCVANSQQSSYVHWKSPSETPQNQGASITRFPSCPLPPCAPKSLERFPSSRPNPNPAEQNRPKTCYDMRQ